MEEGDNPLGGDDRRGDSDESGDFGGEPAEGGGKTGGGSVGRVRKWTSAGVVEWEPEVDEGTKKGQSSTNVTS